MGRRDLAPSTLESLAADLQERRRAILHAADAFHGEAEAVIGSADRSDVLDSEDPAAVGGEDSLSLAVLADERLADINEALQRIADGTFGICQHCHRRIPLARLRALPTARLCIDCKRKHPSG